MYRSGENMWNPAECHCSTGVGDLIGIEVLSVPRTKLA